ncbi:prenyl carboxy-lyase [Natronorubrum sp. JWXQ-INN-674]|uniref:Prenyl carboxy-lyase n=1 Tax=Natronorubrum halalkaliphilum TaxID=2691917 RepID=A0A6B0VN65_9EURY|nr:UbiD family decarboxylase domain-containing protein [Natronorubrum halalkaliphilum]MXV62984.1 prenyl carboxy-lyase [Natronorubrum halalkaliphilum]
MTAFRTHLEFLRKTDELCSLERPESPSPQVVAAEALRADGPAVRFRAAEKSHVGLASGVYGGVDQLTRQDRSPWTRLGIGLGVDRDPEYVDVLEAITDLGDRIDERDVTYVERAATATDRTVRELGLPTPPDEAWPHFTLGLLSVGSDDGTYWAPIHGTVLDGDTIRARVPAAIRERFERGESVTVALGVPAEALAATTLLTITDRLSTPIEDRRVGSTVPVIPTAGGLVPSSAEVVLETELATQQPDTRSEKPEFWERLVDGATVTLDVTGVFARDDAVVPFTPLDVPLADDLQLVALALAARLYDRVNGYWGVSPVDWLLLPAAGRLGICIVSTEVLYAGFEWQLANFLFSRSDCFDTVVLVDEETDPHDLGRVLGDLWVKAHPSRDWLFSEPDAPVARLPTYERDGTGARLYVDATWDPRWDEEYIAPRVSFLESYPPDIRTAVRESWTAFGFDSEPDDVGGA